MSNDHRFMSAMRHAAEQAGSRTTHMRLGLRTSYDPAFYAVKVLIQPDNVETGFIPLVPQWCGNGWGFFAPPPAGAQVAVHFEMGGRDHGVCFGAIASNVDRPLPVPDGEAWWQHESGAFVKMTNDGSLTLGDGKGAMLKMADGVVTVLATSILLGEGATEPVQLASGQPSTIVKAL